MKKKYISYLISILMILTLLQNVVFADVGMEPLPRSETKVEFEDTNLEEIIKETLGISSENDVMLTNLDNLSTLVANNKNITSLKGLEHARGLQNLYLSNNNISDIAPLENVVGLTILDLSNNNISDISSLKILGDNSYEYYTLVGQPWKIRMLNTLYLKGNQISNVSALKDFTNLRDVDLSNNQIITISGLEDLTSMLRLNLSYNQISDISPLQNLIYIYNLKMAHNQISDISPLQNNERLDYLDLNFNQISDISPLQGISTLEHLYLSDNQIQVVLNFEQLVNLKDPILRNNQIFDISGLENLPSLEYIDATNNQLTTIPSFENSTKLTGLSLNNNLLNDISEISKISSLEWLDADNNQIQDIPELTNLPNLRILRLVNNLIKDISPVRNISISYLELDNNFITDVSGISTISPKNGDFTNFDISFAYNFIDFETSINAEEKQLFVNEIKYSPQLRVKYIPPSWDIELSVGEQKTLNPDFFSVYINESEFSDIQSIFNFRFRDSITYHSENPDIATVDAITGNVTAIKGGTARIIATYYNMESSYTRTSIEVIVKQNDNNPIEKDVGKITIIAKDQDTNIELSRSVQDNLTLGYHTITAPTIDGKIIIGSNSKTVELSLSQKEQEIVFYYTRVPKGTIITKYLDEANNIIAPDTILSDMVMGDYIVNAKTILGYKLTGTDSKTVSLNTDGQVEIVVFNYIKTKLPVEPEIPVEPPVKPEIPVIPPKKKENIGVIKGQVRKQGKPFEYAEIMALGTNLDPKATITDAKGYYEFNNLAFGDYVLIVKAEDTFVIKMIVVQ